MFKTNGAAIWQEDESKFNDLNINIIDVFSNLCIYNFRIWIIRLRTHITKLMALLLKVDFNMVLKFLIYRNKVGKRYNLSYPYIVSN